MTSTTKAPIDNVPYDVLREIFIYCLPENRHTDNQPNVEVAPMLLCQVCSSWRRAALTSAVLWTHLSFSVTILEDEDEDPDEADPPWAFFKVDIEFVKWWKNNHRAIPPYLNFATKTIFVPRCELDEEYLVPGDSELDFIVMYLTSARSLCLDYTWWRRIGQRVDAGDQISFENLHTIMGMPTSEGLSSFDDHPFRFLDRMVQPDGEPTLRLQHLCLLRTRFTYFSIIPTQWSTLTHIYLRDASISDWIWFSLISIIRSLQWGYFQFSDMSRVEDSHAYRRPGASPIILSELTTLFILTRAPLWTLFTNVHLPALRTLSLDGYRLHWASMTSIASNLSIMFKSAPNITDLSLGRSFLYDSDPDQIPQLSSTSSTLLNWRDVPYLVHLQLEPPRDFKTTNFIRYLLSVDELGNTISPVRTITLNAYFGGRHDDGDIELPDSELMAKMKLQIVADPVSAIRRAEDAWKGWCS